MTDVDETLKSIKRELEDLKRDHRRGGAQKGMDVWKVATVVLGVLFAGFFAYSWFDLGSNDQGFVVRDAPAPTQGAPSPQPVVQVSMDDDPVEGDEDAPVTLIEFGDFECPFCGRFFAETMSLIRTDYVETGKVKIVDRDLPLAFYS